MRPATRRLRWIAATLSLAALVAGCGSDGDSESAGAANSTPTLNRWAAPTIDGTFVVDNKERRLALRCWGDGAPPIVLDGGDAGIGEWQASVIVRELATRTRVCLYDRAGRGLSDAAPVRRRVLDDAAADLHRLLAAAEVPGPYVLVGASGGGFNVYHHAGRYPDEVVGLVMLDVPAGQANMPAGDVSTWDGPGNPEHMDYFAVERQMAVNRLPIPSIPVTVVTARGGQSADPSEQRVWLAGSSKPVQLVLEGGHEIDEDAPTAVREAIGKVLDQVRGGS